MRLYLIPMLMHHFHYQLEFGTTCLLVRNLFIFSALGMEISRNQAQDDSMGIDADFLMNVTRIDKSEDLKFFFFENRGPQI